MVNKAKAQGTAWETAVVGRLRAAGFQLADRIKEGGSLDEGDVAFEDRFGENWIVECKARANYNVTQGLAKAKLKAANFRAGKMPHVVVAWKKLTRKDGNERRSADGEPDVVIMDWETYMMLVQT